LSGITCCDGYYPEGCARLMNEAFAGPVPGSPVPASAIERLTLIADNVVKANGGGVAPAWVSVVVTTHGRALASATPCDWVAGDMQAIVYLMTMEGQFVHRGPRPPRAKARPVPTCR
jgi:hypothetical protein